MSIVDGDPQLPSFTIHPTGPFLIGHFSQGSTLSCKDNELNPTLPHPSEEQSQSCAPSLVLQSSWLLRSSVAAEVHNAISGGVSGTVVGDLWLWGVYVGCYEPLSFSLFFVVPR